MKTQKNLLFEFRHIEQKMMHCRHHHNGTFSGASRYLNMAVYTGTETFGEFWVWHKEVGGDMYDCTAGVNVCSEFNNIDQGDNWS